MSVFKIIQDYPNYEVSSMGEIRNIKSQKILSQSLNKEHYVVTLYNEGKGKMLYVHRLQAKAFLDNPLNLPFVDHKDRNPKNNKLENLRWCSVSLNTRNTTTRKRGNITKINLKGGGFSWRVCIGINGLRHRKNFDSEEKANNYLQKWIIENDNDL